MIVWLAEWLAKRRYWAAYLLLANFVAWGVLGLGVVGLYFLFTAGLFHDH